MTRKPDRSWIVVLAFMAMVAILYIPTFSDGFCIASGDNKETIGVCTRNWMQAVGSALLPAVAAYVTYIFSRKQNQFEKLKYSEVVTERITRELFELRRAFLKLKISHKNLAQAVHRNAIDGRIVDEISVIEIETENIIITLTESAYRPYADALAADRANLINQITDYMIDLTDVANSIASDDPKNIDTATSKLDVMYDQIKRYSEQLIHQASRIQQETTSILEMV